MSVRPKGFTYVKADYNYISYFKDGAWSEGVLREDDTLTISAMSTALHYGQQCFEGLSFALKIMLNDSKHRASVYTCLKSPSMFLSRLS